MRKERKILRFVPQKLRKSFANGNPNFYKAKIVRICGCANTHNFSSIEKSEVKNEIYLCKYI